MEVFEIEKVLASLSQRKPIFHSEKDMQASFADEVKRLYPNAKVEREVAYNSVKGYVDENSEQPIHASTTWIDVLVSLDGATYLVELKYKRKALTVVIGDQQYDLKQDGAWNDNRYRYLHDVQKLEDYVANEFNGHKIAEAYAVFITNDAEYQKEKRADSVIKDFDLSAGKVKTGVLRNTNKPEEQTVFLAGSYTVNWSEYSRVPADNSNIFWACTIRTNEAIIRKS